VGMSPRTPGLPGWGSLESETVECGHESCRNLTWK
jgi:hypothetical protein